MTDDKSRAFNNRERLVDSIYDNFFSADNDTRIPLSEFRKYEILFSTEARDRYLSKSMTADEVSEISELSSEFFGRVNPQKPIHIVDDYTGEDVCPPLPPLFVKTNFLVGKGTEAMDIFVNTHANDDNIPNAVSALQKKKATANLMSMFSSAQSAEELLKTVYDTNRMCAEFNSAVFPERTNSTVNDEIVKKSIDNPSQIDDGPDAGLDFF